MSGESLVAHGLLRVLAELLRSRNERAVVKSAEIVGILALESERLNLEVVACNELLCSLVAVMASDDISQSSAAVSAVADVAITAAARRALQECGMMDYFMSLFGSLADSLSMKWDNEIEEHLADALHVADTLLLDHSEITIQQVPTNVAISVFSKLRNIWKKDGASHFTRLAVAKILARLGMEVFELVDGNLVESSMLLGIDNNFFEKHWEQFPAVITKNGKGTLFYALKEEFQGQSPSQLLRTLVGGSVSCPPAYADELDHHLLFKEIREDLGKPLVYQQDLRLVKCNANSWTEQHYYTEGTQKQVVRVEDCVTAFELGYTVAIRGMEFRSSLVAKIAHVFGRQLGQASIGANLYLTPPNSQGLALHYDDHCVFVVQLVGEKKWSIGDAPTIVFPRLYAPRIAPDVQSTSLVALELAEDSVLYIPRGFAHQASTSKDDEHNCTALGKRKHGPFDDMTSGRRADPPLNFSLHLTFGVEVEPPFEWEGFIHIALHIWFLKMEHLQNQDGRLRKMLLHFAIRSMVDRATVLELRKACSISNDLSANETFKKLNRKLELALHAEESQEKINAEDCAAALGWLVHLPETESLEKDLKLAVDFTRQEKDWGIYYGTVRGSFFQQALFDYAVFAEARDCYVALLEKYRTSRRKLINAMLSLHCL